MFNLLGGLLVLVLWFGSVIAIIKVDAKRQRRLAEAQGQVDFMDRSVWPYIALTFISGALPLIFYFGITRRGAMGWLLGIGAFMANTVAVSVVGAVFIFGGQSIDRSLEHKKNLTFFEQARAACNAPLDRSHAADDPCKATLYGANKFSWAWNDADGKPYADLHVTACNGGRAWACDWLVSNASWYRKTPSSSTELESWMGKKLALCKASPGIDPSCEKL